MEAGQGKLFLVVVAWLLGQPAPPDGRASGMLTLNGQAVALTHAYVSAEPGMLDKAARDLRILLSDVPLPAEVRADAFALIRLGREGKASVVEVVLDSAGEPLTGAIYARVFRGMVSLSGLHRFTREQLNAQGVAGRMWTEGPRTFAGVTFHYDARFTALLKRVPSEQELAAALEGPAARAAGDYIAALRRRDLPAFSATLTAAAAAGFTGSDGEARFARLAAELPADTRVVSVLMHEDGGTRVTLQGHQDGIVIEYVLNAVEESGRWKIGR